MNILIVGWDAGSLYALRDALSLLLPESEIQLFTDPFWAVKYAYHRQVDLLFTETEMRGLSGSSVVRLVRGCQTGRVSAFYLGESEEACRAQDSVVSADGFVLKPVSPARLKTLLRGAGQTYAHIEREDTQCGPFKQNS